MGKNQGALLLLIIFAACLSSVAVAGLGLVMSSGGPAPAPAPAQASAEAPAEAPAPDSDTEESSANVSDDGRCGPNNGGKKCTGKQCCSKSGWCGGEKGVNSNWCVNIDRGWWNGKYDGEEKAPDAKPIQARGGYTLYKGKFLPTAKGTDVNWKTGEVMPVPVPMPKKVDGLKNCRFTCDGLDACKGFTYMPAHRHRRCWFKTDLVQTTTLTDSDKYDTYIKEK